VHVKMRHALTHRIVDGHKRPLGSHPALHCLGQVLRVQEQRTDEVVRKIQESLVMVACDQQAVPLKKWFLIQKRKEDRIFKHNCCFSITSGDLAKFA